MPTPNDATSNQNPPKGYYTQKFAQGAANLAGEVLAENPFVKEITRKLANSISLLAGGRKNATDRDIVNLDTNRDRVISGGEINTGYNDIATPEVRANIKAALEAHGFKVGEVPKGFNIDVMTLSNGAHYTTENQLHSADKNGNGILEPAERPNVLGAPLQTNPELVAQMSRAVDVVDHSGPSSTPKTSGGKANIASL